MQKYQETKINLNPYKKAALETAFYPRFGENILYPVIAIVEECGELMEKLEDGSPHEAIAKELGDILWYSAMVYHELDEDFSFRLEKTYMIPSKLIIYLSKISGIIKKSQRDQNGEISEEKKKELLNHMDLLLSFVHNVGSQIDYTIEEVCDMNIRKIESRKERGMLAGSGDDR
ncbi:MAG: hypothetical protein CL760_10770 [Chloroflexi bacterium]|nr:hypothetical protein [Chloroflexota bacterium]|tara:strand:+ start:28181 stop:28702 length:522 start_codon:yes stop_codon:yes gene_type:complete